MIINEAYLIQFFYSARSSLIFVCVPVSYINEILYTLAYVQDFSIES